MKREIWKAIPEFEGRYEVSNIGRIRSLITNKGKASGTILKPYMNHKGYWAIDLMRDGKQENRKKAVVHRCVAVAFISPPPSKNHQVNHKDGNKLNNSVNNLEWVTPGEHLAHTQNTGLFKTKVSDEQVNEIIIYLLARVPQTQIALKYGISQATVSKIKHAQTRTNVTKSMADQLSRKARTKGRPPKNDIVNL